MEELDKAQSRLRIKEKGSNSADRAEDIISTKNNKPKAEQLKPIGFIASKNKDFSIKKIYPVSTFFHKETKKLIICLIDKEIKIYDLD